MGSTYGYIHGNPYGYDPYDSYGSYGSYGYDSYDYYGSSYGYGSQSGYGRRRGYGGYGRVKPFDSYADRLERENDRLHKQNAQDCYAKARPGEARPDCYPVRYSHGRHYRTLENADAESCFNKRESDRGLRSIIDGKPSCYRNLPKDGQNTFDTKVYTAEAQECSNKPESQHAECYKDLSTGAKSQWSYVQTRWYDPSTWFSSNLPAGVEPNYASDNADNWLNGTLSSRWFYPAVAFCTTFGAACFGLWYFRSSSEEPPKPIEIKADRRSGKIRDSKRRESEFDPIQFLKKHMMITIAAGVLFLLILVYCCWPSSKEPERKSLYDENGLLKDPNVQIEGADLV